MSPAVLLLLFAFRHHLWPHTSHPALVWNLCGSIVVCVLLLWAMRRERSRLLWLVVAWWLYEEAQVIICSAWRMWDWWPVAIGQEQCGALFGVHLGALSAAVLAWFAVAVWTTPKNKGGHD